MTVSNDSEVNTTLASLGIDISVALRDGLNLSENQSDLWGASNISDRAYKESMGNNSSLIVANSTTAYLGFGIPNTPLASKIVHYCFGVLLAIIGVTGATGNGLVLYVFTRYRRLRGGGVPLILSLAAGDFCVSILHFMPAYSSFREIWSFGMLGCELYAASVGLCGLASLLTLSVIAAERFCVIIGSPISWLSSKKACVLIWVASAALVFPPFVGYSKYITEGLGTSCSWDYTSRDLKNRLYYIFLLTLGFVIPVTIIVVSYLGILYIVCKQSSRMNDLSRNGGMGKKSPRRSDLKTAQVCFWIFTFFILAWSPYSFIGQFGDASLLTPLGTALPAVFAKASVIYNPFIYGLSHPLFRTAVATLKAKYFRNNDNHHHYNSPYYQNKYLLGRKSKKMKVLVKAKSGRSTTSATYDHRRPFRLDGNTYGFKGKIPKHFFRHFSSTGNASISEGRDEGVNNGRNCGRDIKDDGESVTLNSTPRTKHASMGSKSNLSSSSLNTSNKGASFKNRQKLRKGIWIFKQPIEELRSDSEETVKTAVVTTCNEQSTSISGVLTDFQQSNVLDKRKSDPSSVPEKRNRRKHGESLMKNSYTFFLCEYRKRRQENIQKNFFRSENCLISDSSSETGNQTEFAKVNVSTSVAETSLCVQHIYTNAEIEMVKSDSIMMDTNCPGGEEEKCHRKMLDYDVFHEELDNESFESAGNLNGCIKDSKSESVLNGILPSHQNSDKLLQFDFYQGLNKLRKNVCKIQNQTKEGPHAPLEPKVILSYNKNGTQNFKEFNKKGKRLEERRSTLPSTSYIREVGNQPLLPFSSTNCPKLKQGIVMMKDFDQHEIGCVGNLQRSKSEMEQLLHRGAESSPVNILLKRPAGKRRRSVMTTGENENRKSCNKKEFHLKKSISLAGFKEYAVKPLSHSPDSNLEAITQDSKGSTENATPTVSANDITLEMNLIEVYRASQINNGSQENVVEGRNKKKIVGSSTFHNIDKECGSTKSIYSDSMSPRQKVFSSSLDEFFNVDDYDGTNSSLCSESCYASCQSELYSDSSEDEDDQDENTYLN